MANESIAIVPNTIENQALKRTLSIIIEKVDELAGLRGTTEDSFAEQLENILATVDTARTELEALSDTLNEQAQQLLNEVDDLSALDTRVTTNEGNISTLSGNINKLDSYSTVASNDLNNAAWTSLDGLGKKLTIPGGSLINAPFTPTLNDYNVFCDSKDAGTTQQFIFEEIGVGLQVWIRVGSTWIND